MTFYSLPIATRTVTVARLSNTSVTTILTADNGNIEIGLIHIANVDATDAVAVTVDIYDGTTATKLTNAYALAAKTFIDLEGTVLLNGWSLRVTSGDADGQLHVVVQHTAAAPRG
jgi:hypothetical protein